MSVTIENYSVSRNTLAHTKHFNYVLDKYVPETFKFDPIDGIVAILFNEDWSVYEYFENTEWLDTAVNFATHAPILVHWDLSECGRVSKNLIQAMLNERALYADCFGKDISTKPLVNTDTGTTVFESALF